jgi:hypothetical protein
MMKNVGFKVSEAGRQRVLREKCKNVHAGVVGEVEALWGAQLRSEIDNKTIKGLSVGKPWMPIDGAIVRYNPYETQGFIRSCDGVRVERASRVMLDGCTMLAEGLA